MSQDAPDLERTRGIVLNSHLTNRYLTFRFALRMSSKLCKNSEQVSRGAGRASAGVGREAWDGNTLQAHPHHQSTLFDNVEGHTPSSSASRRRVLYLIFSFVIEAGMALLRPASNITNQSYNFVDIVQQLIVKILVFRELILIHLPLLEAPQQVLLALVAVPAFVGFNVPYLLAAGRA